MSNIHEVLSTFSPAIIAILDSIDFFQIEGTYDAQEVLTSIPASAWRSYEKESKAKNTAIWGILSAVLVPRALMAGARQVGRSYDITVERKTVQGFIREYYDERGLSLVRQMTATDKTKLKAFIWSNANQNERPLAKQVMKEPNLRYITDLTEARTRTIKRTEIGRATRAGSWGFARDVGFAEKTWMTAGDARVRPSHAYLNGVTIPIDKDFSGEGQYPSAINCRCHLTYG